MEQLEVGLPYNDLLLPWALEHDMEAAEIILAVQAKAAKWRPPRPAQPPKPVAIRPKVLPQPDDADTEKHTSSSLNELDDLAGYVADRSWQSEPMPAIAQLNVEPELPDTQKLEALPWNVQDVTDNLPAPLADTQEARLTPTNHQTGSDAYANYSAPAAQLSVTRSKSVRLTDRERETALRLGLKSPFAPTYRTSSVLDDYERVARPGRRSAVPSKNLLIKRVVAQNEKCGYCDRLFGSMVLIDGNFITLKAEPDHFTPRAKRLNNSPSNIVAACQVCNGLKSSRSFTTIEQARIVLQAAWIERGWGDAPLLVPYKLTMPLCLN
jgi:5-methylcytosine-specific restriction endonuclease McrA